MDKIFRLLVLSFVWLVIAVTGAEADKQFSNTDVRGPYGFSFGGTATAGVPVAAIGRFTADGQGGISGGERTLIVGGALILRQTFSCTYSVSGTGTGTATCVDITPPNPDGTATENFDFVIVENGKEAHFVSTKAGDVVKGVAGKQ